MPDQGLGGLGRITGTGKTDGPTASPHLRPCGFSIFVPLHGVRFFPEPGQGADSIRHCVQELEIRLPSLLAQGSGRLRSHGRPLCRTSRQPARQCASDGTGGCDCTARNYGPGVRHWVSFLSDSGLLSQTSVGSEVGFLTPGISWRLARTRPRTGALPPGDPRRRASPSLTPRASYSACFGWRHLLAAPRQPVVSQPSSRRCTSHSSHPQKIVLVGRVSTALCPSCA